MKDILTLAREAGMTPSLAPYNKNALGKCVPADWLQRFAELVRADAVPDGWALVPVGYVQAAEDVLAKSPCDCSDKRRYEDGEHLSGCHLFDLNTASVMLEAAPKETTK